MEASKSVEKREGLSLQTLVVAAVASGGAAVVVSSFWKGGTVAAATVTPVCVAVLSELLRRPLESELLRTPVRRASEVSVRRISEVSVPTPTITRRRTEVPVPPAEPPFDGGLRDAPPPTGPPLAEPETGLTEPLNGGPVRPTRRFERSGGPVPAADGPHGDPLLGPVRTYAPADGAAEPEPFWRRLDWSRLRWRVALVTGLVAFLIAAVAITVPELIFGGSVAGGRSTTLLGGHDKAKSGSDEDKQDEQKGDSDEGDRTSPNDSSPSSPRDQQQKPDKPSQDKPSQDQQDQPPDSQQQPPQDQPPSGPAPSSPVP